MPLERCCPPAKCHTVSYPSALAVLLYLFALAFALLPNALLRMRLDRVQPSKLSLLLAALFLLACISFFPPCAPSRWTLLRSGPAGPLLLNCN